MSKRYKSWLENYLYYTHEQESPELFHLWSGLTVLSSTIGRSIYLNKGYYKVYPNIYVVLVAPSGVCRKTTACAVAVGLLDEMRFSAKTKEDVDRLRVNVVREKITPQALTQFLAAQITKDEEGKFVGKSECLVYAPELAVFLGAEASANGLLALLTSLYDSPDVWEYRTKTQGTDYLFNVYVTILGASTPVWLFQGIPNDVVGAGLFARIILVAQRETARRVAFPKVSNGMAKIRPHLIEQLIKIKQLSMEVQLSSTAEEYYTLWYSDREMPQDERFMSFFEREHDHVIKIAILLAASYGDLFTSNVLSKERLEEAIVYLDKIKETMPLAYEGIGDHIAAKGYEKVLEQIKQRGGEAEHSWLLNRNWYKFDTESFKKVIDLLIETGKIKVDMKGRKKVYRLVRKDT
jgi:hypothetical protein